MREILFRGKAKSNNKWHIGWYQPPFDYKWETTDGDVKHSDATIIFLNYAMRPDWAYVDEATVGQYTGLEDKNGKKIFEGDIVEGCDYDEEDGYGVVEWHDGAFYVHNGSLCGTFFDNYRGKDFEVIGNIHDNPELIGGTE